MENYAVAVMEELNAHLTVSAGKNIEGSSAIRFVSNKSSISIELKHTNEKIKW
jgi:hypothetical protein